jgi:hypothetical protein
MLRRLPLGFAGVVIAAIAIAACSSSDATQTISVGPNFPAPTLYVANVTQNAIGIYTPVPRSTGGPAYVIAGSNTTLQSPNQGPQYLAFDSTSNLWVTTWGASTTSGALVEFEALATGNVIPYQTFSLGTERPRGIVAFSYTFSGATTATPVLAIAEVNPNAAAGFSSGLAFFERATLTGAYETLAGPNTGLNVPSGVAFATPDNIYVTNLQGASVEEFALPTPTPSPSPTASPTATPSPTAKPSGATATPSPTPSPTASPLNIAPIATISGAASGIGAPTGIALDSSGNIYVSDQASTLCSPKCPAILIFPPGSNGAVAPKAIDGSNTLLVSPTDVKVDKNNNIYVADEVSGAGVIYVYPAGSAGNVAPTYTLKSPGAVIGLGLIP